MTTTQHRPATPDDVAYSIDPNDAAKTVVVAGLGEVPVAGKVLGPLVDILWPESKEDVWGEIRDQVEKLVKTQLTDYVLKQTQADLDGLAKVLKSYVEYAKPGHTPSLTSSVYTAANEQFNASMGHFTTSGFEVVLLPMWAQAANMHVSLLRDGVLFGRTSWGWNDVDHESAVAELQDAIATYTSWAPRIFGLGFGATLFTIKAHACEPFRGSNAYRQQMLFVLDLAARWPCFDPTVHPEQVPPEQLYLDREMYTTPVGTADDSGLFFLPQRPPSQPLDQITVWAEPNLIDAVQVGYPAGGGPDGVTVTARMGSQSKGNPTVVPVSKDNPVTGVTVWAGDVVQGLQLTFRDGSSSPHFGSSGGTRSDFGFADTEDDPQILSSLYVNGTSSYYGCVDALVCGFQYPRP